jgi:predicted phage tail protein
MKAFLASVVVAVVISVGASFVLDGNFQMTSPEAYTTTGARITSPGDNLVEF